MADRWGISKGKSSWMRRSPACAALAAALLLLLPTDSSDAAETGWQVRYVASGDSICGNTYVAASSSLQYADSTSKRWTSTTCSGSGTGSSLVNVKVQLRYLNWAFQWVLCGETTGVEYASSIRRIVGDDAGCPALSGLTYRAMGAHGIEIQGTPCPDGADDNYCGYPTIVDEVIP